MAKNEEKVWKLLEELIKSQKETDRRMKETDRRMKETDRRMKETDRRMKETDRMMKETDRRMKEIDRRMGRFINGFGSFIEGLAAPSISKIFERFNIDIIGTSLDQVRHMDGKTMEVDILAIGKRPSGKKVTVVVEMKSRLRVEDVSNFIQDLKEFLQFFDEYKESDVIGVVGGIRIDEGVLEYAEKRGLCVIAPSDDIMVSLNRKGFTPKIWNED